MSECCRSDNLSILKVSEIEEWLDQLSLSRPKKRIHRDFSDGMLLAEIIKHYYPKLVDMHNYSSRNSFTTKLENWSILKGRVLKKLHIHVDKKAVTDICSCVPGVIDKVLFDLRDKIRKDEEIKRQEAEGDKLSSDGSWYDVGAIDDDSDIMIIPMRRRCGGDNTEMFKKKVISYDSYEILKNELIEKNEAIEILKQKVSHLDNLLRTRDSHMEELQKSVSRKSLRSKKNEISLIDIKPEMLTPALENNDLIPMTEEELNANNTSKGSTDITCETISDLITFIDS